MTTPLILTILGVAIVYLLCKIIQLTVDMAREWRLASAQLKESALQGEDSLSDGERGF